MGAWGTGGFDNDTAGDWLDRLLEENDVGLITNSLSACSDQGMVMDADSCCQAVVAAEVTAASGKRPCRELPEEMRDWLRDCEFVGDAELFELAERAIVNIQSDSELAELWEGDGKWKRSINGLLRRLRSGPKVASTRGKSTASQMPDAIKEIVVKLRKRGARLHIKRGVVEGLEFDSSDLNDDDLSLVADLPDLRGVFLQHQKRITDNGIVQLVRCRKLETIHLDGTAVTDEAIEKLVELPLLDDLSVWNTKVSDAGLEHMHRLTSLVKLFAALSNVTPGGLRELAKRFPDCEIQPSVATNGKPAANVQPNEAGFVKCPDCNWRFSVTDNASWDGEKHLKCGQLLVIITSP